ncbi:beta-1,3-glucanase family protein [Psychromonas sp.]|nr:beta-1,3-glucanase family protein [Psychromonas sp.]
MKFSQLVTVTAKKAFLLLYCLSFSSLYIGTTTAQTIPLPYEIINLSEFSDEEIYVALVGKIDGTDVWMDMATGEINEMQKSDNTLQGPIHNGNKGPGGDGKYADSFTLLSNIPNTTFNIPHIYAVRVFISFKSPLYLYFFGDGGGYSAPSLSNDSDPNLGLKYELIELTYGDNGLWTNTTRVDAYQYPMGLEVWGTDGFYKRVGEVLTHDEILTQWRSRVGDAFQSSLDESLEIILNPSKSTSFQEGEAYNDYFSDYVDAVWNRYETEDMHLSIGEAGLWIGRVTNDQFIFTNQDDGTVGMISAKPNTLEILEASGVLAEDVSSTESTVADQNVQKHFSAAFNRGAIDLNAATGELLEWSDIDTYFGENTHNEYVAFWHSEDISFEGETYAFAYDDVFDYSSTIQSTIPEKVKITIGGFVNDPYVAAEYIEVSSETVSLATDETAQITATMFPENVENPAIIWTTSDSAVATVVDGMITALNTGTAAITASNYEGTVSKSVAVEVNGGDYSNETTQRIEAEDYTEMSGIQTQETNDNNGTLNVGWIDVGDFMEYEITIPTAGNYTIAYRISSVNSGSSVDAQVNGNTVLSTNLKTTGSWSSWETQLDTLVLPEGTVTLRLVVTGENWNLNWFDLTLNETEAVIEEPVLEEPVIEEPVIEEPVTEEPVTEEPVIEEPVIEEPVTEEPVTEEPVIEDPVNEEETVTSPSSNKGGGGSIGFSLVILLTLLYLRQRSLFTTL